MAVVQTSAQCSVRSIGEVADMVSSARYRRIWDQKNVFLIQGK